MRWNVVQVAEALGVSAPPGLGDKLEMGGVSIDSRTVRAGELFFAIRGPRHDGHNHVVTALASGAAAAVVESGRVSGYPEDVRGKLFGVDDTLAALQRLASRACTIWRAGKPGRKIAGVAGSVGKTTTKEILAALVAAFGLGLGEHPLDRVIRRRLGGGLRRGALRAGLCYGRLYGIPHALWMPLLTSA